jgi:hypothetical protein
MWDRFSERDKIIRGEVSKYNKQDVKDEWDKMDKNQNGLKFGSFVEWIKKDDKLKAGIIIKEVAVLKKEEKRKSRANTNTEEKINSGLLKEKEWSDNNPDKMKFTRIIDDKDAGKVAFEYLKDRLVYCSGQIFYKYNNIWIHDKELIKASLRVLVLDMPIFKELQQGTIVTYAGDLNNTE